jgi:hypothetical protein
MGSSASFEPFAPHTRTAPIPPATKHANRLIYWNYMDDLDLVAILMAVLMAVRAERLGQLQGIYFLALKGGARP